MLCHRMLLLLSFSNPGRTSPPHCCLLSPVVSTLKTVTSIAQRKRHPLLHKGLRVSALGRETARLSRGWGNWSRFQSGLDRHGGSRLVIWQWPCSWHGVCSLSSCVHTPPWAPEQPARCMALTQEGFSHHQFGQPGRSGRARAGRCEPLPWDPVPSLGYCIWLGHGLDAVLLSVVVLLNYTQLLTWARESSCTG